MSSKSERSVKEEKKSDSVSGSNGRASICFEMGLPMLVVIGLTVMAYQPVLFDFFLGDDFVHLIWLKKAMVEPGLILRNFHSNWLDITTTSFYRPLISVFMASDYYFGGANGLAFHLTNLFFHLVATVTIFFLGKEFYFDAVAATATDADTTETASAIRDAACYQNRTAIIYGITCAAIFGFYPLHSEAVAWITGRVDAVVTAFICLALLFYRRWRSTRSNITLLQTLIFMVAGLMSKEMAITLPAVFFAYSFWLEKQDPAESNEKNIVSRFVMSLKASSPFFLLLAFYFLLRRIALGTFVGGYDNSLLPLANLDHFFRTWVHGIRMFLIPLNREVVSAGDPLNIALFLCLPSLSLLLIYNLFKSKAVFRLNLFNLSFLLFAFLPVYKLFAIANDLQGSRLAQVATVSLALILGSGCIFLRKEPKAVLVVKLLVATVYLVSLFVGLRANNLVWASAGQEVNAIRTALAKEYETIPLDPQVLLLNLPDNINGAYATRNALDGITKAPQFPRDIKNCLMISPYEPIIPFGFLTNSLIENNDQVIVLNWSKDKKQFEKVKIESGTGAISRSYEGANLHKISSCTSDNCVLSSTKELKVDLSGLFCQNVQVLAVHCAVSGQGHKEAQEAVLHYTNQFHPEIDAQKSLVSSLEKKSGTFYFPLASRPDWFFGGRGGAQYIKLLSGPDLKIAGISILRKVELMPELNFENSGYMGTKGYLHLSDKHSQETVTVDASNIPSAKANRICVAQPNKFFKHQNAARPEENLLHTIDAPLRGSIILERKAFPSDGIYQVRCFALDKDGSTIGLASDHFVVSVDN